MLPPPPPAAPGAAPPPNAGPVPPEPPPAPPKAPDGFAPPVRMRPPPAPRPPPPPWLSPPLPPWARPLISARLLSVTAAAAGASTKRTRNWLLPLTRRLLPLSVIGVARIGSGLARESRPPGLVTLMVPPAAALASRMAWRSEPGPASAVVVTAKVPAARVATGARARRDVAAQRARSAGGRRRGGA